MEYHIWELVDNSRIKLCVDIDNSLKENFKKKIEGKINSIARELNINPTRLYEYFIYKTSFIPLNILLHLCDLFSIDKLEMESKIISYKQKNANIGVKNPKLPLQISPLSTFLVAHLYFDGSLPNDGRGTYYNNKSQEIMDDFINATKFVFGDIDYRCARDHRNVLKCGMPRIIGQILKKLYQVESFGTKDSDVSKFILKLPYEHKLAFLIGAIVDEGSIAYDGSVIFGVMNYKLAKQTLAICEGLGMKTNGLKRKKNLDFYYFYIKDINTLNIKAKQINKKFPLISLGHKIQRLQIALEIKSQNFEYTAQFARMRLNKILLLLKEKPTTINFLSAKLLIPPKTIRRYMLNQINQNKIFRKKVGKEYIYSLI